MGIIGKLIGLAVTVAGAATVASKLAKKKEEREEKELKIITLEKELAKTQEKDIEREKEMRSLRDVLERKEKEKNDHSKCKNCGAQNLLHASFCNICGQELFAHKKVVTKNCSCCGAQINGLQGQVVKCNYCDSKTTI